MSDQRAEQVVCDSGDAPHDKNEDDRPCRNPRPAHEALADVRLAWSYVLDHEDDMRSGWHESEVFIDQLAVRGWAIVNYPWPLRAEVSYRFEEIEPVPEGWQHLRNEFDHGKDPEHPYWALYRERLHPDRLHWVELRRITQRRYVSEWEDR